MTTTDTNSRVTGDEAVREVVQKVQGFVILLPEIGFGVRGSVFHTLNDIPAHDDKIWWLYACVLPGRVPIPISLQGIKKHLIADRIIGIAM